MDINKIDGELAKNYVATTRKLIESILHTDSNSLDAKHETIELLDDLTLKFTPESNRQKFEKLMNSDYFDLIHFDQNKIDINQYTTINSCF